MLQVRPFVPLRIVTTAGTTSDILHPDLAMVGINSVTIGTPDQQHPDYYSGVHVVSFFHIVRVELMTPAAPT
jgi:hypothetical protein